MRTLVIQLARFGDIYQSWPLVRALHRRDPANEVHILVRERFRAAADSLAGVVVHAMPTRDILKPIVEADDLESSHEELKNFFAPLQALNFDRIINLTFSPLSSYITDWLATPDAVVSGYSRHADGHFNTPDDVSSYFHAQVGVGRANRYHITELFASVGGVDLSPEDIVAHPISNDARVGIVVHLAASTVDKAYPAEMWKEALENLSAATQEPIVLIGSKEERPLSETVAAGIVQVENRVGETTLDQLFPLIATAKLLIGADSAPIHIASLSGTPVLNLSCNEVNFWETGPISAGSRVIHADSMAQIAPQRVSQEALAMVEGRDPMGPIFIRPAALESYQAHGCEIENFTWSLVQALYTGTPYPPSESTTDRLAFQRLFEISELALQQLAQWNDPVARPTAAKILAQIDGVITEIARLNPRVEPLIQWFETERLRIPPLDAETTLERTRKCFQDLFTVCLVYRELGSDEGKIRERAAKLCMECAPEIREHNMQAVSGSFQALVSTLHDLARYSTKVADQSWSSVLDEVNSALERRDFIELADILQWKLAAALKASPPTETFGQEVIS